MTCSYFDDVEDLLDTKSLTVDKLRKLYVLIADVLEKNDSKRYFFVFLLRLKEKHQLTLVFFARAISIKVLQFLDKYLSTFVGAEKDVASAKDVAVRAVKLVLKSPIVSFIARIDLVGNPAVAALKSDSKNGKLFQLLEIYSTKTLTEYLAFQKAAGSFFKDNGGLTTTRAIARCHDD